MNSATRKHAEKLGAKIAKKRTSMGITLQALAELLNKEKEIKRYYAKGVLRQNVFHWEKGVSYPPRIIDPALCRVLNLTPADFVF